MIIYSYLHLKKYNSHKWCQYELLILHFVLKQAHRQKSNQREKKNTLTIYLCHD